VGTGIFDGKSGYDLLVTLLPFPVLLGIITLIHFSPPDDSRAGSNLADGGFTRRRIFRDSDSVGGFSALWGIFGFRRNKKVQRRCCSTRPLGEPISHKFTWNFLYFDSVIAQPPASPLNSHTCSVGVKQEPKLAARNPSSVCLPISGGSVRKGRPDPPLRRTHAAPQKPTQSSSECPTSSREGEWLLTYSDKLTPRIDLAPPCLWSLPHLLTNSPDESFPQPCRGCQKMRKVSYKLMR
jgi:hypothetical protein